MDTMDTMAGGRRSPGTRRLTTCSSALTLAAAVVAAALLLVAAGADASSGSAGAESTEPSGASRGVGGTPLGNSVFDWLVVMWNSEWPKLDKGWPSHGPRPGESPWDARLAGYGVRLRNNYMICDLESHLRSETHEEDVPSDELKKMGGVPDPTQYIATYDIDARAGKQNQRTNHPTNHRRRHILTLDRGVALFEIVRIRRQQEGDVWTDLPQLWPAEQPVLRSPTDDWANYETNCYLHTYTYNATDSKLETDETRNNTASPRAFSSILVRKNHRTDRSNATMVEFEIMQKLSRVCMHLSDTGAPIMCGHPPKLSFVVARWEHQLPRASDKGNCRVWFRAVRLSHPQIYEMLKDPEDTKAKYYVPVPGDPKFDLLPIIDS